jgi:hypothetical protein
MVAAVILLGSTLAACGASGDGLGWRSGAFAGYQLSQDVAFGAWRGRPISSATDYLPADTWSEIEDPSEMIRWWHGHAKLDPNFAVSPWPSTGGSLEAAATGAYDRYFVVLARHLVAGGLGSVGIRLGWEFNADYYRWAVKTPAEAADFAAAWRQTVSAMRSVSGAKFTFIWTPYLRADGIDPALAYPGNAYVSDIGLDVYDWNLGTTGRTAPARWRSIVDARYGLAWQAAFAHAHGLPLAYPEWGVVSYRPNPAETGGDDPYFVTQMFHWFSDHDVAFEDYFDSDSASLGVYCGLTTGSGLLPQSAAAYRLLWRR